MALTTSLPCTTAEEVKKEKGLAIPIHVDAASGGFIAPFLYPDLLWDFRLPNVKSINVSGHKYVGGVGEGGGVQCNSRTGMTAVFFS